MKRVLLIAFHFPPVQGSSGVQRTLRFARYLPDFGWEPIVLTAHPRAYAETSDDQLKDIPPGVRVIRAPAWDSSRHLSIAGRYPGFLARPDRWMSWWLGAVPAGLKIIREFNPLAIWSTYPIATAHRIGGSLARLSALPWIADFRDPMVDGDYPSDPAIRRSFEAIQANAIRRAACSTFTTPSALAMFRRQFPERANHMALLENGYDEETFAGQTATGRLHPERLTLLHSGVVYPSERDPTQLFAALRLLKERAPAVLARLGVRFRAPIHFDLLADLARTYGVEEHVELAQPVPYREALAEMLNADGLLILQAANCNAQVPAKLYEYLRARRPVLTLTDPAGDTAQVVRDAGIGALARLDDAADIASLLERFVAQPDAGTLPTEAAIRGASRRGRTEALAGLLDRAVAHGGA
ncbi:MAG TPA: glycosyltransferase [Rhodocyclaceae bacterium]|nr:glycosyltransferase [Rhodocyclaceae bacterium]